MQPKSAGPIESGQTSPEPQSTPESEEQATPSDAQAGMIRVIESDTFEIGGAA